jgi:hypothetical protein
MRGRAQVRNAKHGTEVARERINPETIMLRRTIPLTSIAFLASAACAAACGGVFDESVPQELDSVLEPLSNSAVCNLVLALTSIPLTEFGVPINITTRECRPTPTPAPSALSYLGSTTPASFSTSAARLNAQSLYCALKGADGASIDGTASLLGTFGARTHFNVYDANPTTLKIKAQRLTTLFAFGLPLTLENQPFDWSFDTENQISQTVANVRPPTGPGGQPSITTTVIPNHTGQYALASSGGMDWRFAADGSFPIGIGSLKVGVNFFSRHPYFGSNRTSNWFGLEFDDNRAYAMSGIVAYLGRPQETDRRNSWNNYLAACNSCLSGAPGGINTCDCPTAQEVDQHYRQCGLSGCNDAYYRNLTDGRLPHEGRRGASGPFFDRNERGYSDFWHYGKPGPGANIGSVANGEPVHQLTSENNATSGIDVTVGYSFDVGPANIGFNVHLDAEARSGIALRDYRPFTDTGPGHRITQLGLDAEGRTRVDAKIKICVDIPFIGNLCPVDETIDLIPLTNSQSFDKLPTRFSWDEGTNGAGVMGSYLVNGVATPVNSCLAVPPVAETPLEAGDPSKFVTDLRNRIEDNVWLCNVQVCTRTSTGGTQLRKCTWDAATEKLNCFVASTGCSCFDTRADLCDSWGRVHRTTEPDSKVHAGCYPVIE